MSPGSGNSTLTMSTSIISASNSKLPPSWGPLGSWGPKRMHPGPHLQHAARIARGCMETSVFRCAVASRRGAPCPQPFLFWCMRPSTRLSPGNLPTAPYWPMSTPSPSSPRTNGRCSVLERVSQLSAILGLKTNPSKTQVYRWAPPCRRQGVARRESPTGDTITWGDVRLPLQPPIFH